MLESGNKQCGPSSAREEGTERVCFSWFPHFRPSIHHGARHMVDTHSVFVGWMDGWASAKLGSLEHVNRPKGKSDTRAEEGEMCVNRLGIGEKVPINSGLE